MRSLTPLLICTLFSVPAWPQPATLAGFSDQGAFILFANEERIGRLEFQWRADGAFESKTTISLAGQSTSFNVVLTPDAEGRWIKAVIDDAAHTTKWERKGAVYSLRSHDVSFDEGAAPVDTLTYESETPPLVSQALRRFDASQGNKQTLPVLLLDTKLFDDATLVLERVGTAERTVHGRPLKLTSWIYSPPHHELHVLADQDGRVYLASGFGGFGGGMPEHNVVFVREGFEELREVPPASGPDSQPKHDVEVKAGISMPMRDGVELSTDLYFPAGAAKSPVILIRTPYKKEMEELRCRYYARRGYVVAVQDVRGRFASEGVWEPFLHEAKDGYDTIEWLARQSWSSGKVGMIGASYLGWVQWWAASLHPPHLAAMIPNVSPPDPFHNMPFDDGMLYLQGSLTWAGTVESNATGDLSGKIMAANENKDMDKLLQPLPVIDLDKAVLGKESAYWRQWMSHPSPDAYWSSTMFLEKLKDLDVPVFHQSGWFDGDGIGTKLNYLGMAAYGHAIQKLTVGPWEHSDTAMRIAVKRDFGPDALIDLQRDYLRWFDHWLKGVDNGIDREPRVSLFLMGADRWLHSSSYPLPETRFEKLYLSSGGKLGFQPPAASKATDSYVYDPGDPTPTLSYESKERATTLAARKDILVYTTDPFEKPYTIAGPLSAVIYASSSARDTDWFVHLVEVDADGKATILWANASAGHIRARYRNSLAKTELLKPGKIYKYEIDLWHTGLTIAPGHRLRVEVSSAAFPLFDRNLNTGGNNETETKYVAAHQTIYHDAKHPSYILLPMIPEK